MSTTDKQGDVPTPPAGVSRRQFMTTAAGVGASLSIVPRHVLGRGFQAPSDLVNVAVVGVGGMGANNLRNVMSQNVVAICDVDSTLVDARLAQWTRQASGSADATGATGGGRGGGGGGGRGGGGGGGRGGAAANTAPAGGPSWQAWGPSKNQDAANGRFPREDADATLKKFVSEAPRIRKYADYREMLEKQKDIDAIIVATPDHMHAVITSAAMDLGTHVYVQKPMAWSVHEARHLARRAAETKVQAQCGNQRHSGDEHRRGVDYVKSGVLGDVTDVHVWTNRPIWPQGIPRPAPFTVDPSRRLSHTAIMQAAMGAVARGGAPPEVLPRVPHQQHEMNWIRAIKGQDTLSSPFSYAAHLHEIMLLGLVSLRAGSTIDYDGANMRVTNNADANQYLTREYRQPYSL